MRFLKMENVSACSTVHTKMPENDYRCMTQNCNLRQAFDFVISTYFSRGNVLNTWTQTESKGGPHKTNDFRITGFLSSV